MNADVTAWCQAHLPHLQGRRFLITGAASGLGLETAAGLASRGAAVILADRNVEGGRAAAARILAFAPSASVEFLPLDLAELGAVRQFAAALLAQGQPLDGLINNAGILPPLQRRTTRDGFELKFGINVLGHYALTGLLLPLLTMRADARVVWVTSLVHKRAEIDFADLHGAQHYEPQRAYNQAKLACLMLALELDARARGAGLSLQGIAAHPGVARTPLGESRKGQVRHGLHDHLTDMAFWLAMRFFSQSQSLGALPILYAAAAKAVVGGGFYGPDGWAEMRGAPTSVQPSRSALDPHCRQKLWLACEQLTGIAYDLNPRPSQH